MRNGGSTKISRMVQYSTNLKDHIELKKSLMGVELVKYQFKLSIKYYSIMYTRATTLNNQIIFDLR